MGHYFTKAISAENAAKVIDTVRKDLPDLDWIVDARSMFCPDNGLFVSNAPGEKLIQKGYEYMSARPEGLIEIEAENFCDDVAEIPKGLRKIEVIGKFGPAVVTLKANENKYYLTVHYYEDEDLRKYIEEDKIQQFRDYCKEANKLLKIYLNY